MTDAPLSRTPLYAEHVRLGAKLVPFAGWEMPIQYQGIAAEHTAVRERVGLFDVSHMGELRVTGPGALAAVDAMPTVVPRGTYSDHSRLTLHCCRRRRRRPAIWGAHRPALNPPTWIGRHGAAFRARRAGGAVR